MEIDEAERKTHSQEKGKALCAAFGAKKSRSFSKAGRRVWKNIEMQQKFLAAQRAINNRIQHDRLAASGVSAAILPSKIHG